MRARRGAGCRSASSPTSPRGSPMPCSSELGLARALRLRRERRYAERAQAAPAAHAARREARRRSRPSVHLRGRRAARRAGRARGRHARAGRHLRVSAAPMRTGRPGAAMGFIERPRGSARLARPRAALMSGVWLGAGGRDSAAARSAFLARAPLARAARARRARRARAVARPIQVRGERRGASATRALARMREQLQAVFGELAREQPAEQQRGVPAARARAPRRASSRMPRRRSRSARPRSSPWSSRSAKRSAETEAQIQSIERDRIDAFATHQDPDGIAGERTARLLSRETRNLVTALAPPRRARPMGRNHPEAPGGAVGHERACWTSPSSSIR